jgi:subtilisin family serine protease
MKAKNLQRKKHTGRNLVLLNPGLKREPFFKRAKSASIKLAHFNDYISTPEKYLKAFSEADGIYFEGLNVAVINFNKEDELVYLNEKYSTRPILFTEPERYVYKIGSQRLAVETESMKPRKRKYRDTDKFAWGIRATGVSDEPYTGQGINIAILDTGIFKQHIDLAGRKIITKKFVSGGSATDIDGHGTHCAGVACGYTDESGLRYGVAYKSNIYCGKVLNDQGEGTDGGILAGIEWSIAKKCKVISMSLGAASEIDEPYSETYENVARRAMKQGSLIVAAAGNESDRPLYVAPVGHPANCPSILAVGAIDSSFKIAGFSCGGMNEKGGQVDLVAPGVSVYSMINVQHGHDKWDGTSMATPFVAGIAALFFEQNSGASPMDVWSLLSQHARRLDISSIDGGSGLVQAPIGE